MDRSDLVKMIENQEDWPVFQAKLVILALFWIDLVSLVFVIFFAV